MQFSLFELHSKGRLCPDIIVHNLTRKPIRHVPAFSAQIILIEFTCVCWSPSKLNTLDLLISFSFFLYSAFAIFAISMRVDEFKQKKLVLVMEDENQSYYVTINICSNSMILNRPLTTEDINFCWLNEFLKS